MRDIQIETKNKVYFELKRNNFSYIIEIVEKVQASDKRFNIVVTRIDDPTDRDYLSISQVTMIYSEIQSYLEENLKIYLTRENRISYLALSDNKNVFEPAKKPARRGKTLPRNIKSAAPVTEKIEINMDLSNSIEVDSPTKHPSSRYKIAGLAEFEIVRDGTLYAVTVRE